MKRSEQNCIRGPPPIAAKTKRNDILFCVPLVGPPLHTDWQKIAIPGHRQSPHAHTPGHIPNDKSLLAIRTEWVWMHHIPASNFVSTPIDNSTISPNSNDVFLPRRLLTRLPNQSFQRLLFAFSRSMSMIPMSIPTLLLLRLVLPYGKWSPKDSQRHSTDKRPRQRAQ